MRFLVGPLLLAFSPLLTAQSTATLTIDTSTPVAGVSPTLYGIMTEEINYSYDGGLYAELVSNRTFQTNRGPNLEHWTLIQNGDSRANIGIDKTTGPSTAIPHSLKLTVAAADAKAEAGFYNAGSGAWRSILRFLYQGSFYAKAENPAIGSVTRSSSQRQDRSCLQLQLLSRRQKLLAEVRFHTQDEYAGSVRRQSFGISGATPRN